MTCENFVPHRIGKRYSELFNRLGEKGLPFINASPMELEKSYQHFEKLMEQQ
jgi:hypothetical protein